MCTGLFSWKKVLNLSTFLVMMLALMPLAQAVPMLPGVIRVVKIIGIVTATNRSTEKVLELNTGSSISEDYIVDVGPESSVVLLFSNGATLSLTENTKLSIDEFLQEPNNQSKKSSLAQVNSEPTSSKTRLFVNYGTVRGSVKKLNAMNGSRYDIGSPIGIAGIRGTTFELVISESGSDYTGSFSVGEGSVYFISRSNNYLPLEGTDSVSISYTPDGEVLTQSTINTTIQTSLNSTTSDAIQSFDSFTVEDFDSTTPSTETTTSDTTSSTTTTDSSSSDSTSSTTSDSTSSSTTSGSLATTSSSTTSSSSSTTSSSTSDAPPAQAESSTSSDPSPTPEPTPEPSTGTP